MRRKKQPRIRKHLRDKKPSSETLEAGSTFLDPVEREDTIAPLEYDGAVDLHQSGQGDRVATTKDEKAIPSPRSVDGDFRR